MSDTRQHAHDLIDRIPEAGLAAVVGLLERIVDPEFEDEEISEEEAEAVRRSREYFRQGGEGIPFEQVVAECGFTMEQIRSGADLVAAMQASPYREVSLEPCRVLAHYEGQSEEDAVAEDEAGVRPSETVMNVPHELVAKVRELIGKRRG
jgi:hypothetical protein